MSQLTLKTAPVFWLAALALLLFPLLLRGGTGNTKAAGQANVQNQGERLFQTNCSRCHMPPMNISPRATGTILMHMRTRARLSREDEQALLKFMAP